ncbi:MAG: prepilin-type N-terminal cleavage/methylation domain-containing protein [Planctomycetota bacterium]
MTPARPGFTFIELLVVLLLIGMLLPALGASRRTARQMANNTQLRGIHQGMVTFAQANKRGGADGRFPGLGPQDELVAAAPAGRLQLMLEGNFFTPDYIVNPADPEAFPAPPEGPVTFRNHSYAMLPIADPQADAGRIFEWRETLNTNAVVLSDRNTGVAPDRLSSVWTERNSGDWRGGVVRNDNSTSFETTAVLEGTKYGKYPANDTDQLFVSETDAGSDAMMIHRVGGEPGVAATP